MPVRNAKAIWEGTLREGKGRLSLGSGTFEGSYSFHSRFEEAEGTNPEELLGAAHAGCFSMAFSAALERAGFVPEKIQTLADVYFEKLEEGFTIVRIELSTEAAVPDIDETQFLEIAEGAKNNCPISRALAVPEINVNASLLS